MASKGHGMNISYDEVTAGPRSQRLIDGQKQWTVTRDFGLFSENNVAQVIVFQSFVRHDEISIRTIFNRRNHFTPPSAALSARRYTVPFSFTLHVASSMKSHHSVFTLPVYMYCAVGHRRSGARWNSLSAPLDPKRHDVRGRDFQIEVWRPAETATATQRHKSTARRPPRASPSFRPHMPATAARLRWDEHVVCKRRRSPGERSRCSRPDCPARRSQRCI